MSDQHSLVAVIIPVYNSMPYVTACLDSLLAQEGLRGEMTIIAVDDGSTDGSGEELDRFASLDSRVHVIHQENSGWPGMPRNRGLDLADADYVFFMDADDIVTPTALKELTDAAVDHGAQVVIPLMVGANGRNAVGLFNGEARGEIGLRQALQTLSPQKLFDLRMLREHRLRFPEGVLRLEDGMFVTDAYLIARSIHLVGKAPLYVFTARDDGENISARPIEPRGYVNSVRAIAGLVSARLPQDESGPLIAELFQRKCLRFYRQHRWEAARPQRQSDWVLRHGQLLEDLVPDDHDWSDLGARDVALVHAIRARDVIGVRELLSRRYSVQPAVHAASARVAGPGIEVRIVIGTLGSPSQTPSQPALSTKGGFAHRLRQGVSRLGSGLRGRHEPIVGPVAIQARRRGGEVIGTGSVVSSRDGAWTYTIVLDDPDGTKTAIDFVWCLLGHENDGAWRRLAAGRDFAQEPGGRSKWQAYATVKGNLSLRPAGK